MTSPSRPKPRRFCGSKQPSLISVLVTGIQSTRVCAAKDVFSAQDLGWLDSCDKHRNEVWGCGDI
ncbi:hypothetical protein CPJ18_07770 [Agrobacterium rosae]|uniref:Uncharacterized protein n=1 Tax=Agrobacterium rosae TaxID=1972867 RepID=A0AAE5VQ15_9HYPH|nr:hypothetical protein DXM21_12635 [Agrobacterium rosae]KAA3520188.1 hypothetical protein DXM25_10980 [Agrobacterium rosae]MQB48989.1 hypothetical protein [Agrobacterium rosae]POO52213.1 hypothetical protein CPJ18_07770 [Agrobacterium rosae]